MTTLAASYPDFRLSRIFTNWFIPALIFPLAGPYSFFSACLTFFEKLYDRCGYPQNPNSPGVPCLPAAR